MILSVDLIGRSRVLAIFDE